MNEKVLKYLYDIKNAIEEIESFFNNTEPQYEIYIQNTLLKRGIERNLEIIGEAMNRILDEDPIFPITHARRIVGLRNQIIHGYDSVSDQNIFSIISFHLPILKKEISNILQ